MYNAHELLSGHLGCAIYKSPNCWFALHRVACRRVEL